MHDFQNNVGGDYLIDSDKILPLNIFSMTLLSQSYLQIFVYFGYLPFQRWGFFLPKHKDNDFRKSSESCHVGIHCIALIEYS